MSLEVGDIVVRGDIRGRKKYRISHFDASGWIYARPVGGGDLVTFLPEHRLKKVEEGKGTKSSGSKTRQSVFEADWKEVYRALQDARAYVTDFDRDGRKAEALYERLARAGRLMRPWSTDGTVEQSRKAVDAIREITSLLSEKIGPASRREFPEQGGSRGGSPTPREIEQDVTRIASGDETYTAKQRAAQAEIKLSAIPGSEWSRARVIGVLRELDTPALREIERTHFLGAGVFGAGRQVAQWSRDVLNERGEG